MTEIKTGVTSPSLDIGVMRGGQKTGVSHLLRSEERVEDNLALKYPKTAVLHVLQTNTPSYQPVQHSTIRCTMSISTIKQ